MIRFSPYLQECLDLISSSPLALSSDALLCHLVRYQHIMEDIGATFHMDDPAHEVVFNDVGTRRHVSFFESRFKAWAGTLPSAEGPPSTCESELSALLQIHADTGSIPGLP